MDHDTNALCFNGSNNRLGWAILVDASFIPLAAFFSSFIISTLRIYFEEPGYTWLTRTPIDRALTTDIRYY